VKTLTAAENYDAQRRQLQQKLRGGGKEICEEAPRDDSEALAQMAALRAKMQSG